MSQYDNQRSRLIWRCRRGIREMDILLQDYLATKYDSSSVENQNTFAELLDEADLDIISWIMQKSSPDKKYVSIIDTIRNSAEATKKSSI